jgi:hypothetical protein
VPLSRSQSDGLHNLLQELLGVIETSDLARAKTIIHKLADQLRVYTEESRPIYSDDRITKLLSLRDRLLSQLDAGAALVLSDRESREEQRVFESQVKAGLDALAELNS